MNTLLSLTHLAAVGPFPMGASPRAGDPGITPNHTGLPGLGTSSSIVGALVSYGLIACVAAIIISAVVWAISHHNGNGRYSDGGKTGVLVSCGGALLIGGADLLVTFFSGAGAALH
jgi:hypothetical protein